MNKTPITVLQELMTKFMEIPKYECVSQKGPQHLSVFEYQCKAYGATAIGRARSKKEAKQEAARHVLAALAARGLPVPPPYRTAPDPPPILDDSLLALPSSSQDAGEEESGAGVGGAVRLDARNSVALLKELCEEYRLGAVTYELVGDTGPPHLRMFTMRAALASHERVATASTKKAARQMAAEQLYSYLRKNLANATKDFVENRKAELLKETPVPEKCTASDAAPQNPKKRKSTDEQSQEVQSKRRSDDNTLEDVKIVVKSEDAMNRALDKAMSRYVEIREEQAWRPDLGQRIADYHLGVFANISEEQREAAERAAADEAEDSCAVLQKTAAALGLTVELSGLPAERGELSVVTLAPAAPALALAGRDPPAAARAALRYLRRALSQRPDQLDQLDRPDRLQLGAAATRGPTNGEPPDGEWSSPPMDIATPEVPQIGCHSADKIA